jgi:hypothetical protein
MNPNLDKNEQVNLELHCALLKRQFNTTKTNNPLLYFNSFQKSSLQLFKNQPNYVKLN